MITLLDNATHQVTMLGASLLAEARGGNIDVTGWRLLEAPEVVVHDDGSMTLKIAVPEAAPRKSKRVITALLDGEPIAEVIED